MSSVLDPRQWLRALTWLALLALVGFIAYGLVWQLQGGRWERVETPSMGTAAPVGSLLWVSPTDFDRLEPGDFITFRPPGSDLTYSHRVLARAADGSITTKGAISGPDPWQLTASDVVGEVRTTWWGVGWLVVASPVLLVGGFVVAAIRSALRQRWRLPATLVLGSLVISIAITAYRPFLDAQQLAFAPDERGGATATYVGTGLLPIRLEAPGGEHVDLLDGEVGSVRVSSTTPGAQLSVDLRPAVPAWWWAVLVLCCFVPALGSLVGGALKGMRRGGRRRIVPAR